MKFKTLYKDNSTVYRKLWVYYIFINKESMIIIDEKFSKLDFRDDLNWDFIIEDTFEEINVNKLDTRRQQFLIRNILR